MAIKSVTAENLAEYVAERRGKGSEIATGETEVAAADASKANGSVSEGPPPGNPVIKAVTETTADAPVDPGNKEPTAAKADRKQVQDRIDELTRLRKEAE